MNIFYVGKPPAYHLGQWISTVVVSFCFFSGGLSVAWASPALMKIKMGEVPMKLSSFEMGILASVPFFTRLLSPIPASYIMDYLGRRGCLIMGRVLQIIHWILMISSYNIWVVYAARSLSGWFTGIGAFVTGVYVGETTHKRVRGRTQALLNVNFLAGTVFVSAVGAVTSYDILNTVCCVIDVVTFIFMFFIPETPYFHLKFNQYELAEKSLKWLRGSDNVRKELNRVDKYLKIQLVERNTYSIIFKRKATRKAFFTVQILLILQRCAGMAGIISYASFIFPHTWWLPNEKGPVVLNLTYFFGCILSIFIIDKWGRKTLLIFSTTGSAVFLCGCTVWYILEYTDVHYVSGTEWIPISFLIGQGAFYSFGFCFIPSLLMSEMFPMNIKAKASALGAISSTFFSGVIVLIFLPLKDNYGMYANFMIYTVSTIVTALFSITIIETRGKALETIQAYLEGRLASDSSISQARASDEAEEA